jgi:sarcosine oxidase subunit alpha
VTGPLTLAEAKLTYDSHTGFFLPKAMPAWLYTAGRLLGLGDFDAIVASGRLAGFKAAQRWGADAAAFIRDCENQLKDLPGPARGSKFVSAPRSGKKAFICFDEDTTLKNVDQAMDMGFDVPELIKRFTSAGTGPGQGGIPGHNLPLYVNQSGSSPDPQPRPTLARPPLVPALMATYAGASHAMVKHTPLHELQKAAGGRMETVGDWKRARRFSDDARCREEIENVRTNVGMLDASTLGKFRLFGPDALKALQRVYVSDMSRMHPGKAKYGHVQRRRLSYRRRRDRSDRGERLLLHDFHRPGRGDRRVDPLPHPF